jgi:hypothetical protein
VKKNIIQLRPYSLAEMGRLYSVCDRTFKKWVEPFAKEIGEKKGRYYTISQVKIIFEKLGLPGEIEVD